MRSAIIGPYTHGGISAIHKVCNEAPYLKDMPRLDISGLLYSNMFQSGVDLFQLFGLDDPLTPKSKFFLKRIQQISVEDYNKKSDEIKQCFQPFLPKDYYKIDEYSAIWTWEAFLTDLFFCLKNKSALIFGEIPDAEQIRKLVPLELYQPLKNLTDQMSIDTIEVPMPRSSISSSSVKRLHEIVESDHFRIYVNHHKELDYIIKPKKQSYIDIVKSSKILRKNYPAFLKIRSAAVSLISPTTKMVDIVFGKLAGTVSEYFAKLIDECIKTDRQIVIYETMPFLLNLTFKRMITCFDDQKSIAEQASTGDSQGRADLEKS